MNYYNIVKHLITQTHIDVNYEIESTVKFDGLKMSLITFCKRDPKNDICAHLTYYTSNQ